MPTVTMYENFSKHAGNKELIALSVEIAGNQYRQKVEEIRRLFKEGKTEEAQKKKKELPAFTPSATFKNQRLPEQIDTYSGVVHLDFDHIDADKINDIFKKINTVPFTNLCFRSPGGNGLKVFVEVETGAEHHAEAYRQVKRYYEELTGLEADEKCKDIGRLCFVSWDPHRFQSSCHYPFPVEINSNLTGPVNSKDVSCHVAANNDNIIGSDIIHDVQTNETDRIKEEETQLAEKFEECVNIIKETNAYKNGKRNDFIYKLACLCNRRGIIEGDALALSVGRFDLAKGEIRQAFSSAYKHHKHEFASLQSLQSLQTLQTLQSEDEETIDYLKMSPSIPDNVYETLPAIIKEGADVFTQKRERDVFLTGALAILSGCLPRVKGMYDRVEVLPNLFTYIIAPAASGKGSLNFAKMLADEYHNFTLNQSKDAESHYKAQLEYYTKNGDNDSIAPEKPRFKVVFIPADCSYSKILWHLQQNEGSGIICETEADTMGNAFKKEWGSYSDLLRKAFHNERLSSSRRTNNEFTEIENPGISLALSGTPNQVTSLIASAEDGLFSRFLFYTFKVDQKWKNVFDQGNNINLTEHFKALSGKVFEMVMFLQEHPTIVTLSPEQQDKLNHQCSNWLTEVTMFTGEEAASVVKRMGLIIYRICMLFSAMRKAEQGNTSYTMQCSDSDFKNALEMAGVYLEHSKLMFGNLPQQIKQGPLGPQMGVGGMPEYKKNFFNSLPPEFTRKAAIEKAKKFGLSPRTTDNILQAAVGKLLKRVRTGVFERV